MYIVIALTLLLVVILVISIISVNYNMLNIINHIQYNTYLIVLLPFLLFSSVFIYFVSSQFWLREPAIVISSVTAIIVTIPIIIGLSVTLAMNRKLPLRNQNYVIKGFKHGDWQLPVLNTLDVYQNMLDYDGRRLAGVLSNRIHWSLTQSVVDYSGNKVVPDTKVYDKIGYFLISGDGKILRLEGNLVYIFFDIYTKDDDRFILRIETPSIYIQIDAEGDYIEYHTPNTQLDKGPLIFPRNELRKILNRLDRFEANKWYDNVIKLTPKPELYGGREFSTDSENSRDIRKKMI